MRDVVVAEPSNVFVKPNLSACVLEKSNTWRLPMARDARRVRFGWGFATSERAAGASSCRRSDAARSSLLRRRSLLKASTKT